VFLSSTETDSPASVLRWELFCRLSEIDSLFFLSKKDKQFYFWLNKFFVYFFRKFFVDIFSHRNSIDTRMDAENNLFWIKNYHLRGKTTKKCKFFYKNIFTKNNKITPFWPNLIIKKVRNPIWKVIINIPTQDFSPELIALKSLELYKKKVRIISIFDILILTYVLRIYRCSFFIFSSKNTRSARITKNNVDKIIKKFIVYCEQAIIFSNRLLNGND